MAKSYSTTAASFDKPKKKKPGRHKKKLNKRNKPKNFFG